MKLSIVILAGGAGSRMKSSTPKVLHKICDKEMIYHSIKEAKKISDDITVVLYHEKEKIREIIDSYFSDIKYHIQDYKNYPGTGGALMGIKFLHEAVLVLNGDMPLVTAIEIEKFLDLRSDITMGVLELQSGHGYGRVIIEDGEVIKIVEEKDASEEIREINVVNSGVYLFKKEILEQFLPLLDNSNKQKEYYLTEVIPKAKESGKKIIPTVIEEECFKGVNTKYDLAVAEEIMQNRIKKEWMLKGVIFQLPQTSYIGIDVSFEGECLIESGVHISGKTHIDNCHIKANSVVENADIFNSTIGPMARIRPESFIEESKIGNFVEVKKSKLSGVKAGHLSYIGDSKIEEGTNIGAGFITCNYDGKNKHKTIIGKNVFIGSDTQIVAPIKIEDNVIIAAGTTVTEDIKEGELAISRTKQINKKGFYFDFFEK